MTEGDEASHLRQQLAQALERIKVLEGQVQSLAQTKELRVITPAEGAKKITELEAKVEQLKSDNVHVIMTGKRATEDLLASNKALRMELAKLRAREAQRGAIIDLPSLETKKR